MSNPNMPNTADLPTHAQLLKSTAIAAVSAAVILVGVVLPAEYGLDPTGIGQLTGLKRMGEIKVSLAKEAEAEQLAAEQAVTAPEAVAAPAPLVTPSAEAAPVRKDTTTLTLAPDEGAEIKVDLKKGEIVKFAWSSDAGKANFDTHADSKTLKISYHGYGKGSSAREEGDLQAAFDGSHGWFWRNRSGAPLTITLETEGPYTALKQY